MIAEKNIPILDLNPEIDELKPEIMAAIEGVLRNTQFIMGPNVKAFEQEFAAYLGVKHAVSLNSGTDALILGNHALGLKPGDEVITTPFTFFATGESISHFHATPVFVDIDPDTFNLDVAQIESKITSKTKAILPVHLFGLPADMGPLMELARKHGLKVLEDVAQAFGADYDERKVGAIGDGGAFSFFPSKNLGAFGDGGMFTTNDDETAETVRMLKVHGAKKKYHNEVVGVNSRLDEIQAAVLRVKLPRIDEANAGRRRVGRRYTELFQGAEGILAPRESDGCSHVYHQYTIRLTKVNRDEAAAKLKAAGISTMVYYPIAMHDLPVYRSLGYGPADLPNTTEVAGQVLSLPIWPKMEEDVLQHVASRVIEVART